MALTSRGKALVAGGAVVAVLGGGMAALALSGNAPGPVQEALHKIGVAPAPVQPCPLTGETLPGDKQPPNRPVLAVKVENTPDAQPLAGLQGADIVYEEVVEGGITRFVVLFNCDERGSGRPDAQHPHDRPGDPGAVQRAPTTRVQRRFQGRSHGRRGRRDDGDGRGQRRQGLHPRRCARVCRTTCSRRRSRCGPRASRSPRGSPRPRRRSFSVTTCRRRARRRRSATVVFSGLATAEWRWSKGQWVRYLDGTPMALESGESDHGRQRGDPGREDNGRRVPGQRRLPVARGATDGQGQGVGPPRRQADRREVGTLRRERVHDVPHEVGRGDRAEAGHHVRGARAGRHVRRRDHFEKP